MEGEIGYVVRTRDACDRIQHEQYFWLADFPDAKARAENHASRIRRLCYESPRYTTTVTVQWGVIGGRECAG